jgi:hypothetical protein
MSRPTADALLRCGALAGALLLGFEASALGPGPAGGDGDDYDLVLECRGALWKAAFDDATAAGLDPGAVAVSFSGSKARTARGEGVLTVTGTEEYRPSHKAPGLPVRYECVVDLSTRTVRSVSYLALDKAGAPVGRPPAEIFRDAILVEACRRALDGEVRSEAVGRGVTAGGNDTEPDVASVTRTVKGKLVELTGTGRARLSKDYEWQPITFGCRWDPKKEEVAKAWYTPVGARSLGVLTAGRQAAMDACRQAVRDAVWDDAERRGYRWPRDAVVVGLERYGEFATSGRTTEVTGEGWYKADARHSQSTPIAFRCAWDSDRAGIVSASFEARPAGRAPSGEIASGKTGTLVCESYGKARKVCPASIRANVRVIRQLGPVPCKAYENWIYSPSGITVWGGCAAEFEFDAKE